MITDTDRAYSAGIIDGEGYIAIVSPKSGHLNLKVCIGMKSAVIPTWFSTVWGGRPYLAGDQWFWVILGLRASKMLQECFGFLREKQDQATVALEFQSTIGHWSKGGVPDHIIEYRKRIAIRLRRMHGGGRQLDLGPVTWIGLG